MEKCIDIAKMYWGKLTTASKVVFVICTLVTIRNLCSSKSIPDFFFNTYLLHYSICHSDRNNADNLKKKKESYIYKNPFSYR